MKRIIIMPPPGDRPINNLHEGSFVDDGVDDLFVVIEASEALEPDIRRILTKHRKAKADE